MKGDKLIIGFLFLVLVMPLALASQDVVYLYNKEKYIDQNVVGMLFDMGMTVTFVKCDRSKEIDLSGYDLAIVNDEYLRCSKKIDPNIPMIVTGGKNARFMGLTKKYKSLKLSSNKPMEVMTGEEMVQVYDATTFDKYVKRKIPLYLLAKLGEREGFEKVAVNLNGRGREIGASIVYIESGSELFNGKVTEDKICFFGISESEFWTGGSKSLFDNCLEYVLGSVHDVRLYDLVIKDTENNVVEGNMLASGTSYKIYFKVENVGDYVEDVTFSADSCVDWTPIKKNGLGPGVTSSKSNTVNFTCVAGIYDLTINAMINEDANPGDNSVTTQIQVYEGELPTLDHDVGLEDLKIKDIESVEGVWQLTMGESYKILVDLLNLGDYTEDITFEGKIKNSSDDVVETFTHVAVNDLLPGDKKNDKAKTVLFNLDEGIYEIVVEAIIDVDDIPGNNIVSIDVEVIAEI